MSDGETRRSQVLYSRDAIFGKVWYRWSMMSVGTVQVGEEIERGKDLEEMKQHLNTQHKVMTKFGE